MCKIRLPYLPVTILQNWISALRVRTTKFTPVTCFTDFLFIKIIFCNFKRGQFFTFPYCMLHINTFLSIHSKP